jgi:hypothetical protein
LKRPTPATALPTEKRATSNGFISTSSAALTAETVVGHTRFNCVQVTAVTAATTVAAGTAVAPVGSVTAVAA